LNEDNSKDPLITRTPVGSFYCNQVFENSKEGKGCCALTKKPIFPSDYASKKLENKDHVWILNDVLDTINS
jgi:hypothetical protein